MRIVISNLASVRVVDATAARKAVLIQNVDPTNIIFVSEDQRTLDSVGATGNPTAGLSLPANQVQPLSIAIMRGALYARASTAPALLEVISFDVDDNVFPVKGLERMERRNFPYVNQGT